MARRKTAPKKQPLIIRSIALTHDTDTRLQQLSQDASDALGWTVGSSALVRALLQYTKQQPSSWASSMLHPLIEREIAGGLLWGSRKK